MTVTDVKIRMTFREEPILAVASVVFDNQFVVHNVKLIRSHDKTFVTMPSEKIGGVYRNIAHPICRDLRAEIESAQNHRRFSYKW